MDFNLQQFLSDMREEQREDHSNLVEKVDTGFTKIHDVMAHHELDDAKQFGTLDKRLVIVENSRRTALWVIASGVVAFLGALAEALVHHR